MSVNMNNPQTRALTRLEKMIVREVAKHPRLTVEDYSRRFLHMREFYSAIQYLIWNSGDLKQDIATGAITPKGM